MGDYLVRLTLMGVGAMNSPRYAPAGVLVECRGHRIMLDGGARSKPVGKLDAWLLTDQRCELIGEIRRRARARGLTAMVGAFSSPELTVRPHLVVHTSHATYGYLLVAGRKRIAWAPEFFVFPRWAHDADLMFAEAAGWARPIRFARGTGGHSAAVAVSEVARRRGVRRLVFAHIGRPTIRAIDAGDRPPFGEFGRDGRRYIVRVPGESVRLRGRAP